MVSGYIHLQEGKLSKTTTVEIRRPGFCSPAGLTSQAQYLDHCSLFQPLAAGPPSWKTLDKPPYLEN